MHLAPGSALPQQVPILIELNFDRAKPLRVTGRERCAFTMLEQAMLLCDQRLDVVPNLRVFYCLSLLVASSPTTRSRSCKSVPRSKSPGATVAFEWPA